MALQALRDGQPDGADMSDLQEGEIQVSDSKQRYGQHEQVNGGTVNDALDARDTAWAELREIREAIAANPEESTADEVRRVVSQRDKLLAALEDSLTMIGRLKKHCQITDNAGYTADGRMLKLTEVEESARAIIAEVEASK
jgi:hypothetical protein